MTNFDDTRCEWYNCLRPATVEREWGDRFCHGHNLWADANYDTHCVPPITAEEYRKRTRKAQEWLDANLPPQVDDDGVPLRPEDAP